jgi:hypothetical protein
MHLFIWEHYGGEIFQTYGETVMLGDAAGRDGAEDDILPQLGGRSMEKEED